MRESHCSNLLENFTLLENVGHNLEPSCAHGFHIQCGALHIACKLNFSEK